MSMNREYQLHCFKPANKLIHKPSRTRYANHNKTTKPIKSKSTQTFWTLHKTQTQRHKNEPKQTNTKNREQQTKTINKQQTYLSGNYTKIIVFYITRFRDTLLLCVCARVLPGLTVAWHPCSACFAYPMPCMLWACPFFPSIQVVFCIVFVVCVCVCVSYSLRLHLS